MRNRYVICRTEETAPGFRVFIAPERAKMRWTDQLGKARRFSDPAAASMWANYFLSHVSAKWYIMKIKRDGSGLSHTG